MLVFTLFKITTPGCSGGGGGGGPLDPTNTLKQRNNNGPPLIQYSSPSTGYGDILMLPNPCKMYIIVKADPASPIALIKLG